MKIGVFGGTFNPIHYGHVNIIKGFKERLLLDRIILIPTNMPPHKSADYLADTRHRIKMCEIAVSDLKFCEVSDIECKRSGLSYTFDTLSEMEKLHPKDELFLLMGQDMFYTIEKWKNFMGIFSLATICCAPRGEKEVQKITEYALKLNEKYTNFKFVVTDIPYVEVSSTEIRHGSKDLIPEKVGEYIKTNNLYSAGG